MGRKPVNDKDRSKMRPISLKDSEVDFIKDVGSGSLTGGVKNMKQITTIVIERLDPDINIAMAKLINLLEKSE